MIGFEFGSGEKPQRFEFFGVHCRPLPTITYVCNAWNIDQHVEAGSVNEIYSRHFFEHLTFAQADKTARFWKKVLKDAGLVTMIVPDMIFHINSG